MPIADDERYITHTSKKTINYPECIGIARITYVGTSSVEDLSKPDS